MAKMDEQYRDIFSRNIGVFTEAEQEKLCRSTVAIAGTGGVGGLLAERLLRLGIGHLKLTDPGKFEDSNLNRQFGSSMSSIGRSKAACVFEQIRDINPQAKIEYSDDGVRNEDDADCLVSGADVVIDEMDYRAWKESLWLGRAARRAGIYYLFTSAIGFGAMSVAFAPDSMTLEEFNGLPADIDLTAKKEISVPGERILPVVPSYATAAMSLEMIQDIIGGKRPVPTCSIGVGLASILAAAQAMNIILRRKEIIVAPRYTYIDLLDGKFLTGEIS